MKNTSIIYLTILSASLLILTSCNYDSNPKENKSQTIEDEILSEIDSNTTLIYKFDNTLFSIPSPYEVSILMKDIQIEYNSNILNSTSNAQNYTDNFKKALNLGIYGADLAYLNIYTQTPEVAKNFATIKIMAEELQLSGSFDANTIQRIERNLNKKDSLLHILSLTFQKTDKYLKDNNRHDAAALVIAGGWIESVYFLTQVFEETQNNEIKKRLGEQKYPLENLIKLLTPYYNTSDQYASLMESLIELAYIYDGIDIDYTYEKPEVDIENRMTTINSSTKLNMNADHINMISEKITNLRNHYTE